MNKISLNEERECLQVDSKLIGNAVRAASKISVGETPTKNENECLSELKDNYPSFFDSSEDEDSTSLLNKIMEVKRYIRKELVANRMSLSKLEQAEQSSSSQKDLKGKGKEVEVQVQESEGKGKEKQVQESDLVSKNGESSKRKIDDEDYFFSKRKKGESSSTSEFIDDLPYNPFDDIGSD